MIIDLNKVLAWYKRNSRALPWRQELRDPYYVWISEVMLQQTRVDTVIPYFNKFIQIFPDTISLSKAREEDVLKIWEGLGYYNRARNIYRTAHILVTRYKGKIPSHYEVLIDLPGIGDYIASAILAFGFKKKIPVLDSNVFRILARLFAIKKESSQQVKKQFKTILQNSLHEDKGWLQSEALMELGALICIPGVPRCRECPLQEDCLALKQNVQDSLPKITKKKKIPTKKVAIGIILVGNKMYVQKREEKSHLGGLWEFPGGKLEKGESWLDALRREVKEEIGKDIKEWKYLCDITHRYSHFQIKMKVYWVSLEKQFSSETNPHRWISWSEKDLLPFPSANHKVFKKIIKNEELRNKLQIGKV